MFRLLIRLKRIIKKKLKLAGEIYNGKKSKDRYLYKSLLILVAGLVITLAYPQQLVYQPVELPRLNDIARENIVAPFDFEVKRSPEQIESDQQEVLANLPLIFDYDVSRYEQVYRSAVSFFSRLRALKEADISRANIVDSLKVIKPNTNIATLRDIARHNDVDRLENLTLEAIEAIYNIGVMPDSIDLSDYDYDRALIRKRLQRFNAGFDSLRSRNEVRGLLRQRGYADTLENISNSEFAELAASFVEPNLQINMQATEQFRDEKLAEVPRVERTFKAGELIVERNTKIDAWHMAALEAMTEKRIETGEEGSLWHFILPYLGRAALIIFTFAALAVFFSFFKNGKFFTNQKFTALMLVIMLEIVFVYIIDYSLNQSMYLIPFAIGGILLTILFDLETGIISTLAISLIVGVIQNFNFSLALIAFLAGTTSCLSVKTVHKRSDFYRSILYLMVMYILAIYLMESMKFSDSETIVTQTAFGVINAILSPIIAMGILPVFESLFNITTDLRLLELSDMNHPLLRRLALEAPGTYHHSILVGNLCEKAAEAIGANPLLARVGTYYHDIGKMEIPEYFVENTSGSKSRHDTISPHMSALIIGSHVKKGLELAEEEDLPEAIMAFIAEHHGTSLMSFFYHKATELAKEEGEEEVPEMEYRYPGPKPRSKETAILMIADSVEAASRTLDEPKPSRIRSLVRKIIQSKFESGELSDSELTMRDLSIMENAFTQMLLGIFHKRVDYPSKEEEE
ncbi:MAG TPA: HDIG domain-containing protein [candidate division Zixibacteria bacterium]|nr:HDIG domain-containing protein [candidate division Zixibacteria bacterium]